MRIQMRCGVISNISNISSYTCYSTYLGDNTMYYLYINIHSRPLHSATPSQHWCLSQVNQERNIFQMVSNQNDHNNTRTRMRMKKMSLLPSRLAVWLKALLQPCSLKRERERGVLRCQHLVLSAQFSLELTQLETQWVICTYFSQSIERCW